jgi:hypothetical protein
MTQALYAYMNNKTIKIKKKKSLPKKKSPGPGGLSLTLKRKYYQISLNCFMK